VVENEFMKITIIGGGGRVGSCAAFALQCAGLVAEIQILDANKDMAEGEALDLLHGSAFAGDQRIYSGDYARAADSDLFLITAGLRRKPDESRLDLINRNVELFLGILGNIQKARHKPNAKVGASKPGGALSDSSEPDGQELLYSTRISLDETQMEVEDKLVNLAPGMAVTIEIKTGTRRIVEYLMSPLLRYRHESLRER